MAIGLLAQPSVAALVAFLMFPLIDPSGRVAYESRGVRVVGESFIPDKTGAAIGIGISVGLVAIPLAALVALPSLAWLLRRGSITLTKTLVAGALIGNLPFVVGFVLIALQRPREGMSSLPPGAAFEAPMVHPLWRILFASVIGLASAAVFWFIAGRSLAEPVDHPPDLKVGPTY